MSAAQPAPGSGARLRPATEADAEAVAALYGRFVLSGRASFELEPPAAEEIARRIAAVRADGLPYLLACDADDTLCGFAYAGPYRPRPAYRHTVEDSVYVAPAAQGRGIGRALLERVVAEATAAGRRQMVAVIGDSANAGSIALHAALGFRVVGTLTNVGWKHGQWVDSVLMQRALGAGDAEPPAA